MTVYLTEKRSQISSLAEAMGIKVSNGIAHGFYNGDEVFILPLAGHLLRLYHLHEYNPEFKNYKWKDYIERKIVPFIPQQFKKKVKEAPSQGYNYPKMYKKICDYLKKADNIYLAPDPDNEGALLALEVVEMCGQTNKIRGFVNLNALEVNEIKKSLEDKNIDKKHYKKMAKTAELRSEYDWSFGINLTIAASVLLGNNRQTLHIGGVKLPTIKLVVERDEEIESFKKAYYYNIKCLVEKDGKNFEITFQTKFDKKEKAERFKKELENIKNLNVSKHEEKNKQQEPPLPFTKTEIQSFLGKKYKMNLKTSNKVLQDLYDKKLTSYPRTSCNYYSEDFFNQAKQVMEAIKNIDKNLEKYVLNIKEPFKKSKAFNNKKVAEHSHTALAPTTLSKINFELSKNEIIVYDTIARRFLMQFMPDYKYLSISGNVKFKFDGEEYIGKYGENIAIEKGWKELEENENLNFNRTLPKLKTGDILNIKEVNVVEVETKPKSRFTPSDLVKAMENIVAYYDDPLVKNVLSGKDGGIGTEATRDIIVFDLINKGYFDLVKKGKKEYIISTQKARDLINLLPDFMTSAVNRAKMEQMLNEFLQNKIDEKLFREKYIEFVHKSYEEIKKLQESGKMIKKEPSEKMKKYAKMLAQKNNIELSDEDLKDYKKIKEIIEKYKTDTYTISDKMRNILDKIDNEEIKLLKEKKELTKEEYTKVQKAITEYIDNVKNTQKSKKYKISEKQKAIILNEKNKASKKVKKLAEKDELDWKEYQEVKKWLDNFFTKLNKNKK